MPKYTGDDSWRERWPEVDKAFPRKCAGSDHECDTLVGEFGDVIVIDRQGFREHNEWLYDTHGWLAFTRSGEDVTEHLKSVMHDRINAQKGLGSVVSVCNSWSDTAQSLTYSLVSQYEETLKDQAKRQLDTKIRAQAIDECDKQFADRAATAAGWYDETKAQWLSDWEHDMELITACDAEGTPYESVADDLRVISKKGYPKFESRAIEEANKAAASMMWKRAKEEWPLIVERRTSLASLIHSPMADLYADAKEWCDQRAQELSQGVEIDSDVVADINARVEALRRNAVGVLAEMQDAIRRLCEAALAAEERDAARKAELERLAPGLAYAIDFDMWCNEMGTDSIQTWVADVMPKGVRLDTSAPFLASNPGMQFMRVPGVYPEDRRFSTSEDRHPLALDTLAIRLNGRK